MGHARLPRVVRLLHQASSSDRAGAGSRGWTSPAKDTTRVSHSEGHTHRHQFQPGIITEPRAVSQSFRWSFRQARHHMTGPYRLDDLPDLTC
jgi:hypothetical protein